MDINTDTAALVTGGANGIGFAVGEALDARGARVALADIDARRVQEAAALLGERARGYACDVTEPASLASLAEAVVQDLGGVDLLFVNAGIAIGGTVMDIDPREVRWLYNDPLIRELAEKRHGEVTAALDRLDQRLGEYAAAEDT
jgi:NAD(P)-dependent dehydrogenase (short-subunit alcohol dehydrogenase family)